MKKLLCALTLLCCTVFAEDVKPEAKEFPSVPKYMFATSHRISATIKHKDFDSTGHGSGVAVDLSDYGLSGKHYMLTAAHVVLDRGEPLKTLLVELKKDWTAAHVVAYDERMDVALIETDGELPELANLSKEDKLEIGDFLITVGSPRGTPLSANSGYLSDKGYGDEKERRYQGSMSVSPGNSGGPVFDPNHKEVVGLITSIFGDERGNSDTPNIAWFVPATQIRSFLTNSKNEIEKYLKKKNKD